MHRQHLPVHYEPRGIMEFAVFVFVFDVGSVFKEHSYHLFMAILRRQRQWYSFRSFLDINCISIVNQQFQYFAQSPVSCQMHPRHLCWCLVSCPRGPWVITTYHQWLRTRSCLWYVGEELKDQIVFSRATLLLDIMSPISRRVFVKWEPIQSRDISILGFAYSASKSI